MYAKLENVGARAGDLRLVTLFRVSTSSARISDITQHNNTKLSWRRKYVGACNISILFFYQYSLFFKCKCVFPVSTFSIFLCTRHTLMCILTLLEVSFDVELGVVQLKSILKIAIGFVTTRNLSHLNSISIIFNLGTTLQVGLLLHH